MRIALCKSKALFQRWPSRDQRYSWQNSAANVYDVSIGLRADGNHVAVAAHMAFTVYEETSNI
jgi:hypothetical protein